jgi:hypothetical protein
MRGRQRMNAEWWIILLKNASLGDQAENGKEILCWILGRWAVSVGGGWNWLRIAFNGGLWY